MKGVCSLLCLVLLCAFTPIVFSQPQQSQSATTVRPAPQGEGRWVYTRSDQKVSKIRNCDCSAGPPAKYEWSVAGTKSLTTAPSILIYADDWVSPGPNTSLDMALKSAGLGYTAHYNGDFTGFVNSLNTGTWSLVVFAQQYNGIPSDAVYTALDKYLRKGGRLIFMSWQVGTYSTHPLIADLGVQYVSDTALGPPPPIHWWYPQHRIVNGVPEFTSLTDNYTIDGQFTNPLVGTIPIAGYTPAPTTGQGTIFTANDFRTVYIGFLEGNNNANLDADAQGDGQEFWYNMISFVMGSPLVLVFTDNFISAPAPNTFPDLALRQLGFIYTPVYSNADTKFLPLITLKNWDLIIYAADLDASFAGVRPALNTYITNGGKLLYHDWSAFEYAPADPLYATMGVSLVGTDFTPEPVYYWIDHPFLSGVALWNPINQGPFAYGQFANPIGSGVAIAGYTTTPSANNAGLIVANNNRTVYKAFIDLQHADVTQLWVNMIRLVGAKNILAFDDDVFNDPTYLEAALNLTGYAYTFTNSQSTMQSLVPARTWDMILLAAEAASTSTQTRDELLVHVNSGGKLIYQDWSAQAGHPINAALGAIFISNSTNTPPIYWWRDAHPLFNTGFRVPEYTSLTDNYVIDSINVQPISGNFQALGGGAEAPTQNVANLVLGNNFRTIFKGFLDGNNSSDLNVNGMKDGEELWYNLIGFLKQPCMFCDDFDNSRVDSKWTETKPAWTENGGRLIGTPKRKAVILANGFGGCEVCGIQATVSTAGGVGNKMWILGWYKDKNNTIEMLFKEENDKIVFKQRVGGRIVAKSKILTSIDPNQIYEIRIEHNAAEFRIAIDGVKVAAIPKAAGSTWAGTVGYQVKLTTMTVSDMFIDQYLYIP